jgi:hypothetical protein
MKNGIKSFNEWLSTNHNTDALKTSDSNLGLVTSEDDAMVVNQLEQFVDRIMGILHNVSEDKRGSLVEKLITDLRNKV